MALDAMIACLLISVRWSHAEMARCSQLQNRLPKHFATEEMAAKNEVKWYAWKDL